MGIADGLEVHYEFMESSGSTIADSSGGRITNDATLYGTSATMDLLQISFPIEGATVEKGIKLNESVTDQYSKGPGESATGRGISFAGWFYADFAGGDSSGPVLLSVTDASDTMVWRLFQKEAGLRLANLGYQINYQCTYRLPAQELTHIGFVLDTSFNLILYVNGEHEETVAGYDVSAAFAKIVLGYTT